MKLVTVREKFLKRMFSLSRKRQTRQNQDITIKIPAGIDDGATIRLRDRGEAVAGGSRGDLYVHIRVKAHKNSLVRVILFLAKNIFLWLMRHWERRLMWKLWTA